MKNTIPFIEYAVDESCDYTNSAFLLSALQWAGQNGVWNSFNRLLAVDMKTVVYSPLQKVQTLLASIFIGCQFNKDINSRLVPDKVAAAMLGLARFPDQSQCNLLLRRFDQSNIAQLEAVHAEHLQSFEPFPNAHWRGYLVVDIDQCGLVADGKGYELSRKGYFVRRRGARGYQLSAAWLGQSGLTLGLRFDPGNVHCSTRLRELVELSATRAGEAYRQVIYRVDGGYGSALQVKWFMATGRLFIAKSAVQKAEKWAAKVAHEGWRLVAAGIRIAEVAAGPGIRGIVCEVQAPSGKSEYSLLLTNLPNSFNMVRLWRLYSERQTIEAFFKVGRNVYGMDNLRSREFNAIHSFLWLVFIGHNILQWVKRALFAESELADIGTRELVEKLGCIPARREHTPNGWRLHLPSQHTLARLFVSILRPQWVQLSLHLYET